MIGQSVTSIDGSAERPVDTSVRPGEQRPPLVGAGLSRREKLFLTRSNFGNWPMLALYLWLEDYMLRNPRLTRIMTSIFGKSVTIWTRSGVTMKLPLLATSPAFEVFALNCYAFPMVPWADLHSVIDCGAHAGTFTLWVARRSPCRIAVVEPNPEACELLTANTSRLRERVSIIRAAVASHDGRRTLYGAGGSNQASFSGAVDVRDQFEVETMTLDSLIGESGFSSVDLIKMDVEGAEQEVFETTPIPTLRHVHSWIVECHTGLGVKPEAIIARLEQAGMEVQTVTHPMAGTCLLVARKA